MKIVERILIMVVVAGLVMQGMEIGAAGVVQSVSVLCLGTLYFYGGFIIFLDIPLRLILKKESYAGSSVKRVLGSVVAGIGMSQLCMGALFIMREWPMAEMMLVSGGAITVTVLVVSAVKWSKTADRFYFRAIIRTGITVTSAAIIYVLNALI
ncbi:MAG: hypothetical protein FJY11_10130 [Bacteroidetes bacterium]|nr:hypothetical protein [Bacteroidota bacterium]